MKSDGTGSEPGGLIPHDRWVTDVLLIRHGQTDWNTEGRMQGHHPVELNDTGRRQVEQTAQALAHITPRAVVSSPILRAVQTAEIVCAALGHPTDAIIEEPGLAEFDMGDWVGRTFGELWQADEIQDYWADPTETVFPGGESMKSIRRRAVEALNRVVAQHGGGPLILVTHGGIVRLLLLAAMDLPLSHYFRLGASNASVSRVQLTPGRAPKVHAVNYTPRFSLSDGKH